VRAGDSLLAGVWYVETPTNAILFNYLVDTEGNIGDGNRKLKVEGMTLSDVEAALRRAWKQKGPGQKEEREDPWYVTIGGWREEADPEVIDRIEGSEQTRMQKLERELQELKALIRSKR
jgi:hypothetical protein